MNKIEKYIRNLWIPALVFAVLATGALCHPSVQAQNSLTPLQSAIEKQRERFRSIEAEDRRDAITVLGSMHHPDASRAAVAGLKDPDVIVRATAVSAILSMPSEEAAVHLIPLLGDKQEFVRREAAYALGRTRSNSAVAMLSERLLLDKEAGVRGAAAVALGEIGNAAAVMQLIYVLDPRTLVTTTKKQKIKNEQNALVIRAAARSLGQLRNSVAVPSLVRVLGDEKAEPDVRREAADALGAIGDPTAVSALQQASSSTDPYLAEAARSAIKKISRRT